LVKTADARYRVGAIGCGRKGTQQARAFDLHPRTQIVAAADTDPENLELFCKRFNVPGYSSYREMLAKEKIDIASTILPTSVNPEVVIGCAEVGVKAILCEKPMASSLALADRMVEMCRDRGIPLAAGDMFRNQSQFWEARRLIDAGELGDVQIINVYHHSDQISGTGCQPLSIMRMFAQDADVDWIFGWVTGAAAEDSEETKQVLDAFSDDDQGMAGVVRFANGVEGHIHYKEAPQYEIEVLCSRGVFATDCRSFRLWKARGGANAARVVPADLEEAKGLFSDPAMGRDQYDKHGWMQLGSRVMDTVQSVVDSVDQGIEPRASGDNGRKVLEIAIGLRESERRGMTAVKFPLLDRSLTLTPKKGRMFNKKEVYGRQWYAEQIGRARQ